MIRRGDRQVTVKKEELLEKLRENRDTHVASYNEAREGFHQAYMDKIDDLIKRANDGDYDFRVNITKPESHEEEYNTVIAMLDMSIEETIELDEESFKNFVLDQWSWKPAFLAATEMYKK